MFTLTFYRPCQPWLFTPKLHAITTPNEEAATIIAGALMRKGYIPRLWKGARLIF